ncbi:MAG: 3-hydroxyacyl-CoA dehydrogenase NAD-binding domain-containing protein [Pirellulales bacterium]
MTEAITLTMLEPDVAALTIDLPNKSANILSQSVLEELAGHLDALEQRTDLAGLIVRSGKPEMFIAGADLREFAASFDIPAEETVAMCTRGRTLFQRLSQLPCVTVAAIGGICVGGGAELACWCDRRVMSDSEKAQIGFPEVKLGLFPGWGGTARSARLVGLSNAVELVSGGDSIGAAEAAAMGLADDVAPADDLDAAAVRMIRAEQQSGQYLHDRARWNGPINISETELGFLGVTANAYIQQQTKGQYPAPVQALEVMLGGAGLDIDAACQLEAESMAQLFGSPVNRALINVFFLTDRNKKDNGLDRDDVTPIEVRRVGVIGAGIMGSGIAAAHVRRGVAAVINDSRPDALAAGVQKIMEEVSYNKQLKGPDVEKAVRMAPLIDHTESLADFAGCQLVVEAIVELIGPKQTLYDTLEPLLDEQTILASNTSTIPISKLAERLARPERFVGMHFFNPVRMMPLVEVIRGEQTSDETIATVVAIAKRIGKSPIVVNDGPGFLVNRLLLPYMNEAAQLLLEGATIAQVERAAKRFGMRMGPCTLYDVIGLDTCLQAGRVMYDAYPDRVQPSRLVARMFKLGRFGQKSGKGFFNYENSKGKPAPDAETEELITSMQEANREFTEEEIQQRLFLPMLVEATRLIESKVVRDVRDIDLGLIFGIGFPPFQGGLLFWADTLGARQVVEMLKPYEQLGNRYHPTPVLQELAASGGKFYDITIGKP